MLRIYVSLPLPGAAGPAGRDVLRGAELAVDRSGAPVVELLALDSSGDDREARAVPTPSTRRTTRPPSPIWATSTRRR